MKLKISALSVYLLSSLLFVTCKNEPQNSDLEETKVIENDSANKNPDFSKQENKLLELYGILTDLRNSKNDSLFIETNNQFSDSLVSLITNDAKTLYYPFDRLQQENAIKITTSEDNHLRIYSWDNNLGGSMRFYNQLFQFQTQDNVVTEVRYASKDAQAFFSKIYTVQHNGTPVYLAISNAVLSSKYSMQQITAYEIKNQQLQETELFKTKNQQLSSISVEFDFSSVFDRPERPAELITLDQNKLKIALVEEDLKVTNKNLIYEWNGEWFHYKGVE